MWLQRNPSRWWRAAVTTLLAGAATILTTLALHRLSADGNQVASEALRPFQYPVWAPYTPPDRPDDWYNTTCLGGRLRPDLVELGRHLELLRFAEHPECRALAAVIADLFTVEYRQANVSMPAPFMTKVLSWVGGSERLLDAVKTQRILHVTNNFRLHEMAFNPARARRPQIPSAGPSPREKLRALAEETRDTCDFCRSEEMTALVGEPASRFRSELSAVVGNTFKLDGSHALVLSTEHSPLRLSDAARADMLALAARWSRDQQTRRPELRFPSLVWDVGLHAGASQVHPHLHIMLSPGHYTGSWERQRRAALIFALSRPQDNYFSALVRAHAALGLTARLGSAVAFAALDPMLDAEVWVVAAEPGPDFQRLYALAAAALERRLGRYCHSSGLALPALDEPTGRLPALARIVSRGDCTTVRADVSSLELFALSSITADPYDIIKELRYTVQKNGEI